MGIAARHPTQPVGCVGDVTAEPFVLPTCPADQGTLQVSENWGQRRPVEPAVVYRRRWRSGCWHKQEETTAVFSHMQCWGCAGTEHLPEVRSCQAVLA